MAVPVRYRVTVDRIFVLGEVAFGPPMVDGPKKGYPRYTVPVETYNGTLSDGTPFKDVCLTADPIFEEPA
jgi:hypothetical protein